MEELKPGEIYSVSGGDFNTANIITYNPAMFVRKEHIDFLDWYVFVGLWFDNQLARVRIPTEKATSDIVEGRLVITGKRLSDKLILYTKKERERTSFQHINDFIDIAYQLIKNNEDPSLRNLKEQITYWASQ